MSKRKTHLDVQQEEVHYTQPGNPSNRSLGVNKGRRKSQYVTLGGSQEAIIVTERRNSQTGSIARIDAPFAGSSRQSMGKGDPSANRRKAPASSRNLKMAVSQKDLVKMKEDVKNEEYMLCKLIKFMVNKDFLRNKIGNVSYVKNNLSEDIYMTTNILEL